MKHFKKVLLVTTGEELDPKTLRRARELILSNQGLLTVAGVVESLPERLEYLTAGVDREQLQQLLVQGHLEHLETLATSLGKGGAKVKVEVLSGTPYLAIIQEVYRGGHDLVMLQTQAETGWGARLFGTTALRLIRKCPCPVWVLKPRTRHKYFRLLAAVDPTTPDDQEDSLNRRILELAFSLADHENCRLSIGHAWTMASAEGLKNRAGIDPHKVDRWVKQTREVHRRQLEQLLEPYELVKGKHRIQLVKGKPHQAIPELVSKQRIDLLIMGSVCRTGIEGLIIGNTAEEILSKVDCSVLVVKPPGFVSPVRPR